VTIDLDLHYGKAKKGGERDKVRPSVMSISEKKFGEKGEGQ